MAVPKRTFRTMMAALAMLAASATLVAAQSAGELVLIGEPVTEDMYVAAGTIEVQAPIQGDLVAAGRLLRVRERVEGDLIAAGETVTLRAAVGDDVRVAARVVDIDGAVAGHLVAAGAELSLGPQAEVADWAWLAGSDITLAGHVRGTLKAAASRVSLAGVVDGDAEVYAERVRVLAGARIGGNLIVHGPRGPELAEGARIGGKVVVLPVERPERAEAGVAGAVVLALLMIVTTVAVYLLFPHYARDAAGAVRRHPLGAFGLGLAVLLLTPMLVLALAITGVGALLALATLALYLVALLAGTVTGFFYLGDLGLRLTGRRTWSRSAGALAAALAVILVALLRLLPLVGGLVALLLLLFGLGGLAMRIWQQYRAAPARSGELT